MLFCVTSPLQALADQGLGPYCDAQFVQATRREMQEAMELTSDQFERAAHALLTRSQTPPR